MIPDNEHFLYLQPVTEIYLSNHIAYDGYSAKGNRGLVHAFLWSSVLILILSCLNYMNMTMARSVRRAREVGIRKVLGGQRMTILTQLLNESFMTVLTACALGGVGVFSILPLIRRLTGIPLCFHLFSPPLMMILPAVVLAVTCLAGGYPARVLSRQNAAEALQNRLIAGRRGVFLRRLLVAGQFGISLIIAVAMIVMNRQYRYMVNKDLGFNPKNVLYAQIQGDIRDNLDAFRRDLMENPCIVSLSAGGNFSTIYSKTTEDVLSLIHI